MTGRNSAVVHAADAYKKKKKMKENKSGFTWFYNFILFVDVTADAKNMF